MYFNLINNIYELAEATTKVEIKLKKKLKNKYIEYYKKLDNARSFYKPANNCVFSLMLQI